MKLSAGTVGTLLFTAVATAAFVWMAKRPVVEGNAMNFGMPMQATAAVEDKMPETQPATTEIPKVEIEPEKVEEAITPEASAPEPVKTDTPEEIKAEEISPPVPMSTDPTESPTGTNEMPTTDIPESFKNPTIPLN